MLGKELGWTQKSSCNDVLGLLLKSKAMSGAVRCFSKLRAVFELVMELKCQGRLRRGDLIMCFVETSGENWGLYWFLLDLWDASN